VFNYRGQSIRNHNRLLGNVEGVDGIKTGYTRASGFNLVSSMRRGNRHLIGVVLGGRSGGSRDATMRNLLAENLDKGRNHAHRRGHHRAKFILRLRRDGRSARSAPVEMAQANTAAPPSRPGRLAATRSIAPAKPSLMAAAAAALPAPQPKPEQSKFEQQAKPEPAPLTSGVIQTQAISAIPARPSR
jgi:D-alanyl-D-alanine carboxypeptidase